MPARSPEIAIVWFRSDLRLADNRALSTAVDRGFAVLPVFILEEADNDPLPLGGASRWWLYRSIRALSESIQEAGGRLILRKGGASGTLSELVAETGAKAVFWNRRYDPDGIQRDKEVKAALGKNAVHAQSFNGALLREPWEVRTKAGGAFGVFTPFWKAECALGDPSAPLPSPMDAAWAGADLNSDDIDQWALTPSNPDWAGDWNRHWRPGEAGARDRLLALFDYGLARYMDARDDPGVSGTSRLSPHLHFGEVSPRQIWHWTMDHMRRSGNEAGAWAFLREIGWRDFNHNLLYHNPDMAQGNYKAVFDAFPWRNDGAADSDFKAWCQGMTGYPLVDAGMRELWQTGFMHNRVRMVVASFLIKHLLIDWRRGEAWFRDTLVDADAANNAANWQWVAGSGADAAPFFRIFNPIVQGEKFDASGLYTRRWVPELARLPDRFLFRPWEAPARELERAGVRLGETYPLPLVDHAPARTRALEAYKKIRGAA